MFLKMNFLLSYLDLGVYIYNVSSVLFMLQYLVTLYYSVLVKCYIVITINYAKLHATNPKPILTIIK